MNRNSNALLQKLFQKTTPLKPESEGQAADGPYLFVGLGNPGREYRENRHNIGFMFVDRLASRLGVAFSRVESKALVTKGDYQGRRLVLAKPQTYMNLSGQAAGALAKFYKIPLDHLLVGYDDVDLPLGTLRIRASGGAGGHKGMGSIIERLGTQEIARLRMGIGRPPGRREAADYVLQDFARGEQEILSEVLTRAIDAALVFATQGINAAMNQFNGQIAGE